MELLFFTSLKATYVFLKKKSVFCICSRVPGLKSYADSNTLQSVMQTRTESQQGRDKRSVVGLEGKKAGREPVGRRGCETQRQEEYRVKWRPAIKTVGTKDK